MEDPKSAEPIRLTHLPYIVIVIDELADLMLIAASDVEVLRAPASSALDVEVKPDSELAQTDDDPFDWPRSPITTRIDELAAERVSIAANVVASARLFCPS